MKNIQYLIFGFIALVLMQLNIQPATSLTISPMNEVRTITLNQQDQYITWNLTDSTINTNASAIVIRSNGNNVQTLYNGTWINHQQIIVWINTTKLGTFQYKLFVNNGFSNITKTSLIIVTIEIPTVSSSSSNSNSNIYENTTIDENPITETQTYNEINGYNIEIVIPIFIISLGLLLKKRKNHVFL